MRIWFDLSNSPHVNMFYQLIKELEIDGHEIVITSRPLANTIDLLNQKKLQHTIVGSHYGKNILKKILGYPIRIVQLYQFLKNKKIDVAIAQSSFHSPVVARLLHIPSIYTNDNEHALGNVPSFICANSVLIPENLSIQQVVKKGASIKKIKQYPGVKEGMYLWSKGEVIKQQREKLSTTNFQIYIRPEPQTAQYYHGKKNFLDETIVQLQQNYQVTILPRDEQQTQHYRKLAFASSYVPKSPLSFDFIATNCSLFIGAGGSMTRELAILGIPTISVYQDNLLEVDSYLISKKLMLHEPDITAQKVINYLEQLQQNAPSLELMHKGKEAYQLFKQEILRYQSSLIQIH